MSSPSLAIFDLDGTLADTLPAIAGAMNAVLRSEGLPEHPTDAYRRFAGDGASMLVRRATGHAFDGDQAAVARLVGLFRERDEKLDADLARSYDGVPEMLSHLERDGVLLAVLTNKEHPEALRLVDRLFGLGRFVAVEGAREGVATKPDPTVLLSIIRDARLTPRDAAYIGDTDTDMRTGRSAGVCTVGCAWGFRDEHELRATGADAVAHHPRDLPVIIASHCCGR